MNFQSLLRSRLWTVLRKQPLIRDLSDFIADAMQEADDAIEDVKQFARITDAYGVTLDAYGRDLGQLRLGLSDDRYREALILRQSSLFRKRSGGLVRELMAILAASISGVTWTYTEYEIATYEIRVYNVPFDIASHWNTILRYVKPEGVRFMFHVNAEPVDGSIFRFDTAGAGFDQGNSFSAHLE
jgi:hypothetical protein